MAKKPTKERISFFCPAYLDEGNLPDLVLKAVCVLSKCAEEFEIVIVEDGSPDGTGEAADRLAAEQPGVRVVHHGENRGYGAALRTGFAEAGSYPLVFYTDGDGQYDPGDLVKMLSLLEGSESSDEGADGGCDMVIGYRVNWANSPARRLISTAYNGLLRRGAGVPYRDMSCSIRLARREVIEALDLRSKSGFAAAELILEAHRLGFRVAETGVVTYPRLHGRSSTLRPGNVARVFGDMGRYALKVRGEGRRFGG